MDEFCIELGYLLDNSRIATLEGPDEHSVHCLVDVPVCVDSHFEVLLDPNVPGDLYTRGYRISEGPGKDMIVNLARSVGRCSTCSSDGSLREGFRAAVKGTVVALQERLSISYLIDRYKPYISKSVASKV